MGVPPRRADGPAGGRVVAIVSHCRWIVTTICMNLPRRGGVDWDAARVRGPGIVDDEEGPPGEGGEVHDGVVALARARRAASGCSPG